MVTIEISYHDDYKDIYEVMPGFTKWFEENNIIPSIGEHLFVSDENIKGFENETKHSSSNEWIVVAKFYEPHRNKIHIWCECVNLQN